jgi:Uma2 family endonuclease
MSRPDEERWQLVDGLAMMVVPATLPHQRIAKNLLLLLEAALQRARPDLETFYELGVRVPGIDDFNPEPDLIVIEAQTSFERYADRFYLIAEVISPSNTAEMIDRKLELYQSHPDNLYCLTIDQDSVHVTVDARGAGGWTRSELTSLDGLFRLPAFGLETTLANIYKGTTLARGAGA